MRIVPQRYDDVRSYIYLYMILYNDEPIISDANDSIVSEFPRSKVDVRSQHRRIWKSYCLKSDEFMNDFFLVKFYKNGYKEQY